MTPHPFDFELNLTRHGTALRQLAVELLRDRAAADDAVQEVWLRALRQPPRHERAVGGWLATMVKNVARSLRRVEVRRARREAEVARVDEVEDHAVVLAREELVCRLVAAVSALDPPFREVIWRRYFEGMAPRDIARASGVPVATVKSRLQRGLQQLREKLGEEGESDWRGALAVAFGLEESAVPAGAAVTTATTWSGVLLMTAWTKSVTAVAVVAVAAVLLWSLPEPNVVAQTASVPAVAATGSVVAHREEKTNETTEVLAGESGVERREVDPVAVAKATNNARLRGRCVDANGASLVGCQVSLGGSADRQRMEAWLRDHTEPEWQDVVLTTGAEGTFTFDFLPPPPFQFRVTASGDGLVTMGETWPTIPAGADLDVGDVVMQIGVLVRGRLVGTSGQPVANVQVDTQSSTVRRETRDGRLSPTTYLAARSASDGRFAFHAPLPLGTYQLRVSGGFVVKSPDSLELAAGRPVEEVLVVLEDPPVIATITGKVVDDADQPVRGALVAYGRRQSSCHTDRDGLFTLVPRDPDAGAVLVATCDGFEATQTDAPVSWGTTGVVLRLQRGVAVTIRVTDPVDAPVADYTVRLIPREQAGFSSEDSRVRARGPFEDGTVTVPGIARGKWLVVVEFPSATRLLKRFASIEVSAPGPNVVALRVETAAHRPLRVAFADGTPAAGTRVQLCELFGVAFAARTMVFTEDLWLRNPQITTSALVLFEGTTDGDGRLLLAGPGQHDLGLQVLGPGHVPVQLPIVRLDDERDLLVTVGHGARLAGKIVPPEVVDELRRKARRASEDASSTSFAAMRRPSVRLLDAGGTIVPDRGKAFYNRGRSQFDLADDGSFDITGLPPGSWRVQLGYVETQSSGGGSTSTTKHCTVTEVTLTEGMTTRVELDLQSILPGTLEGEVTLNGARLGNALVTLQPVCGTLPDGRAETDWINVETDAEGRFTYRGRAGVYPLSVQRMRDGKPLPMLRALTTATVVRGETTRHTFAVLSGTLQLTVLDPAGKPAPYLEILMPDDQSLRPTGPDGTTTAELTAQNITLRVLPKRLQSLEARQQVARQAAAAGQGDPLAGCWITLGTATIAAGQTTTLELRLGPEWEK